LSAGKKKKKKEKRQRKEKKDRSTGIVFVTDERPAAEVPSGGAAGVDSTMLRVFCRVTYARFGRQEAEEQSAWGGCFTRFAIWTEPFELVGFDEVSREIERSGAWSRVR